MSSDKEILTWSFCKACNVVVTPVIALSEEAWKFSLGKFLEVYFYNKKANGRINGCFHSMQKDHILYFACDNIVVRFEYENIKPYTVFIRKQLEYDEGIFFEIQTKNLHSTYAICISILESKKYSTAETYNIHMKISF